MIRTGIRGLGELMITVGALIILFAAYELYGTGIATAHAQHDLTSQLHKEWNVQGRAPVPTGTPNPTTSKKPASPTPSATPQSGVHGIAILHIPRLGRDWTPRVVVEGVTPADLREGPGHYPGTAAPGQIGNFAVAGHRATHGNGFFYLNTLRIGDRIIVETRTAWYTYQVSGTERVTPDHTEVVSPVPDDPGAKPTVAMVTLTTCDPWWDSTHRLVIHGTLTSSRPASQGPPPGVDG